MRHKFNPLLDRKVVHWSHYTLLYKELLSAKLKIVEARSTVLGIGEHQDVSHVTAIPSSQELLDLYHNLTDLHIHTIITVMLKEKDMPISQIDRS